MELPAHRQIAVVGRMSALAVSVIGLAYLLVLIAGFLSLQDSGDTIGDPWFTLLEILILIELPALVVLFSAIHAHAAPARKAYSAAALGMIVITAALSGALHFSILTLSRTPEFAALPWSNRIFGFEWPSVAYAIDIAAWDIFFALAMLLVAPVFEGTDKERRIRWLANSVGILSLAGLAGVITGNMMHRNIGILGYAVLLPVLTLLIATQFRRTLGPG